MMAELTELKEVVMQNLKPCTIALLALIALSRDKEMQLMQLMQSATGQKLHELFLSGLQITGLSNCK